MAPCSITWSGKEDSSLYHLWLALSLPGIYPRTYPQTNYSQKCTRSLCAGTVLGWRATTEEMPSMSWLMRNSLLGRQVRPEGRSQVCRRKLQGQVGLESHHTVGAGEAPALDALTLTGSVHPQQHSRMCWATWGPWQCVSPGLCGLQTCGWSPLQ